MPLTTEGNIVVDGVLASCYGNVDHDVAHMALTLIRWFPQILNWIFGVDDGTPVVVDLVERFGEFSLPDANVLISEQ